MKNKLLLKCLLIFLVTGLNFMRAQTIDSNAVTNSLGYVSPDGIMDVVFDQYGNKYSLDDIRAGASYKNSNGVLQPSVVMCSPGYFNLFFEVGSGMDGTSTDEINRRNVICQVFTDISNFINSPLSTAGNTNRVNIWVRDIDQIDPNSATSGILGLATAFYNVPQNNTAGFGGIADNEIWKTIHSGTDSYTNVASPLATPGGTNSSGGTFYHGMMAFNFNSPTTNWNTDLSVVSPSNLFDLYSVALHEVTHALGFASLIGANGLSKFGTGFNYYSRYDRFLRNGANTQNLITNAGACSLYNYQFNSALPLTTIAPGGVCTTDVTICNTAARYVSANINVPVYTPNCFEPPSSLSHFEDQCFPTSAAPHGNNLYFVMSNANGTGATFTKRHLQPEERLVLCDLGYNTNSIFGTGTNQFNYTTSTCAGLNIAGINDGIDPNGAYLFSGNPNANIQIAGILGNDHNANSFECLADVYDPSATLSAITGLGTLIINFTSNVTGTHLLRYIPVSSTGQRGNITYIYVYVINANCVASACNIVNNGGFENNLNCGQMGYDTPPPTINCWTLYTASPDLHVRGCVSANAPAIAIPTTRCSPASDTWNNGANNNNAMLGMWSKQGGWNEGIQTPLSGGIQPNTTYILNFWAKIQNNFANNLPTTLVFGGSTGALVSSGGWYSATPVGLTTLATVNVPNNNQWNYYTITLNNTAATLNFLTIINAAYLNTLNPAGHATSVMIDDVSIQPESQATSLTLPNTLCINQTISDLGSYLSPAPAGGQFDGEGVTFTNGVFSFDAATAGVGNHIITYTFNSLGCDVSVSDIVTVVNSNVNVNATATPNISCGAQPITLTATGANTYSWQPGNIPGSSIVVVPTVTTTYTVSGTDLNGCSQDFLLPVTIGSTMNLSLNNPTLCTQSSCQAIVPTITGGTAPYTYNWSTGPTVASLNVCPTFGSSINTYTLTVHDQAGCVATATSVVTTHVSPAFTINQVIDNTCNTNPTQYVVNATTPYTNVVWNISPAPGVGNGIVITNPNSLNPTIDWNAYAGTATITVTLSYDACSRSETIAVYPCCNATDTPLLINGSTDPNNPIPLTGLVPNPNLTASIVSISGHILVEGNVLWDNCKINMLPNAKITVNKGTLSLKNVHMKACNQMWDGIYLTNTSLPGNITFVQNNLIEDALNAIVSLNGNTITASVNKVVNNNGNNNTSSISASVNQLIINKCGIGIDIRSYSSVNSVSLKSVIFTSRDFNAAPTFVAGANPYANGNTLLPASYLPNILAAYPGGNYTTYASSNCLSPLTNFRGRIGINVTSNSNTLKVGVEQTMASSRNIFDNLIYGINSTNTNLVSINNKFIYIQEMCNGVPPPCKTAFNLSCPQGTAVCASGKGESEMLTNAQPKFTYVGAVPTSRQTYPNYFEQDQFGIYNGNNLNLRANANDFKIIDETAIHNQFSSNYAIYPAPFVNTPSNELLVISNKIDRAKVAVNFVDNRNALISISNNKINYFNAPAVPTTSTQQGLEAIKVSNVNFNTAGRCYIYNNDIANVQKGITLTKQGYANTRMATAYDNAIYFNQFQSTTPSALHYGIALYGCQNVNLNGFKSSQKYITRNTTAATTLNTAAQVQLFKGIHIENSPGTWVTKFNIVKLPASIYAQGICTNSNFWCNKLNSAFNGFRFNNADIGTQLNLTGYINVATDNEWLSPVAANSNIQGSFSSITNWYHHSGTNFSPISLGISGLNPILTSSTTTPCGFVPLAISDGEDGPGNSNGGGNPHESTTMPKPTVPEREILYGKPVNNNLDFIDLVPERTTWSHRYAQRMLKKNPDVVNLGAANDVQYLDYVNTHDQLNTGKLMAVNDAINDNKHLLAEQQNNTILATNDADMASKEINTIYLKSWHQNKAYESVDSIYLCWLAGQDPIVYGDAVYGAQVMVGDWCSSVAIESNARYSYTNTEEKEILVLKNNIAKIYPNPNNGYMQAEVTVSENEEGELSIHSIDGKLIEIYKLKAGENKLEIQQEQLPAGVYFYKLYFNQQHIETKKIIIVK